MNALTIVGSLCSVTGLALAFYTYYKTNRKEK